MSEISESCISLAGKSETNKISFSAGSIAFVIAIQGGLVLVYAPAECWWWNIREQVNRGFMAPLSFISCLSFTVF